MSKTFCHCDDQRSGHLFMGEEIASPLRSRNDTFDSFISPLPSGERLGEGPHRRQIFLDFWFLEYNISMLHNNNRSNNGLSKLISE